MTMPANVPSRTVSVTVERSPRDVYDFACVPENLTKWATGLGTSGERVGQAWIAQTPQGPVTVRFIERNDYGVLDHYVTTEDGTEIYNPMRVVANGRGSELSFTLFRRPEMSDAQFEQDAAWVERDLGQLKALLEG